MNHVAPIERTVHLPSMVQRAANALASASSAAEVLEARDMAAFAYDAAKRSARLAAAKGAHDTLIAAAHRSQADALEIEAQAKRRLADEYDAAQERGEVRGNGERSYSAPEKVGPSDIGLTPKAVHEARQFRDAERVDPGIVRRTLDDRLSRGEEPTKTALRKAVVDAAYQGIRGGGSAPPASSRRNPIYEPDKQYDDMLVVVGGCNSINSRAGHFSPEYIIGGFVDEGMRERSLFSIRACRDFLTSILEAANAR